MHPVGLRTEFLVVHSIPAGGNLRCFGFRVLSQHPVHSLHVQPQDFVASAQRMQLGPSRHFLERVVGTVVRSPPQDTLHIPAAVVILVVELGDRGRLRVQELTLQTSPFRCFHRRVDGNHSIGGLPLRRVRHPYRHENKQKAQDERSNSFHGVWMIIAAATGTPPRRRSLPFSSPGLAFQSFPLVISASPQDPPALSLRSPPKDSSPSGLDQFQSHDSHCSLSLKRGESRVPFLKYLARRRRWLELSMEARCSRLAVSGGCAPLAFPS